MRKQEIGITLIALVITIVVLVIIASISIGVLGGEDGIIKQAKLAKEATEISEEKEVLGIATSQAAGKNSYGNIEEEKLQNELDEETGKGKTEVTDIGDEFEVVFKDSNRYYIIDKDGKIGEAQDIIKDKNPGDITTGKDGEQLDGSEEKPYEIWCIEDLVAFSNMVIEDSMKEKNVVLKRTLNFKSKLSYMNSERTDFGNLNGNADDGNTLMNEMTTGTGFIPIKDFEGSFNGNKHEIQNIYINTIENAGLFVNYNKSTFKIENLGLTGNITSTQKNAVGISGGAKNIENCYNKANITSMGDSINTRTAGVIIGTGNNIKNCYNTGNIVSTSKGNAGGIVTGLGGDNIENCYNTGNIINSKGNYTGGIASGHGNHTTKIKNCYNTGEVKGGNAGGIIAVNVSIIENCYNIGDVTSVPNGYAGGIGTNEIREIYNCYNTGNVNGQYVGGIAYKAGTKTINCYNTGKVQGTRVGGIFGINENENAIISNCYNIGNIIYEGYDSCGGGILGRNTKQISINNSYNIGAIEKSTYSSRGGIVGDNQGTVTLNKCYYLITEYINQAIHGEEDNSEVVTACNNVNEITPEILNNNIDLIVHEEEWKRWKLSEKGYPEFQ